MKPIDLFRNNFLIDYQDEYNCSGNSTIEWNKAGTQRPFFGAFCITFSIFVIPIYISVARVIWSLRALSCYKIMFACSVNDCINIISNSTIFGIFLSSGEVYCKHPHLQWYYSMAALCLFFEVFYVQSGGCCILLAVNRFLEYTSNYVYTTMFQGTRAWALILFTVPFPLLMTFFTPLMFFDSDSHMFLLNPGIYTDRYLYHNVFHVLNNTLVPCFPMILYAYMLGDVVMRRIRMSGERSGSTNRAALMLSVQSGFIVLIHFNACIIYEVTQYIPLSDAVLYCVHFEWMLIHGLPPFIYLYFNQSIRMGVIAQILPHQISVVSLSTTHV